MTKPPEIAVTADGSQTLLHPATGESYHSLHGAVAESLHVFIGNGFLQIDKPLVNVLEVGFGSGLNALLTLREAEKRGLRVNYTAIEPYPVLAEVVSGMIYAREPFFTDMHCAAWERVVEITPCFTLIKTAESLPGTDFNCIFDLVYHDAFAPDSQPELWSAEVFAYIFRNMAPGGILVTYSAKGDVKRALRAAGFEVRRLPGAPGKRHMLRAVKLSE